MKSQRKLAEETAQLLKETQQQFDTVKITIATAGLLVALGLADKWIRTSPQFFGVSSFKITLILTLASMATIVLGFWVSEAMFRSFERYITNGGHVGLRKRIVLALSPNNPKRAAKQLSLFYMRIPDTIVTILNHTSTVLLLLALVSFIYTICNG